MPKTFEQAFESIDRFIEGKQQQTVAIQFVGDDEIRINSLSEPISGAAKLLTPEPNRNGNYRYICESLVPDANGNTKFTFYSKLKMEPTRLTNHKFGVGILPDGKAIYWY